MVGCCREALPVDGSGQEFLPECQEWSGGHQRVPGVVRRPSRRDGSHRLALTVGRDWLAGTPEGCRSPLKEPGVIGSPFWRCGNGREALLVGQEWSGGPPGVSGVVRRYS